MKLRSLKAVEISLFIGISPLKSLAMLVSLLPLLCLAVIDLNPREIQYIADHLTETKCTELLNGLHVKTFLVERDQVKAPRLIDPSLEKPCVDRLTNWTKGPGQNLTFDYLVLRLKEIGLKKISDKISRSVLGETSAELHRYFLDDPFKAMIPKSSLIEEHEVTTQMIIAPDEEDKEDDVFIAVIVVTTLTVTLLAISCVCLVCPRAAYFACLRGCPSFCSSCCEIGLEGCHRFWYGSRKTLDKYMLVSDGNGGALDL